ncbi:hypothetical protein PILCRDRAFT_732828 [Piloderma croceum F 1598]|uniref:Uncharacterized protein n=1 Tax=Piloderma croceum (strain F 1598) TaxID=765440 RepID=A0A0C3EZP3_PILCF|nr:hypothetical protein PILCRDRAFT_732828 [Piloderma croceum F 1598]
MHNAREKSSITVRTLLFQYSPPDKVAWEYNIQKDEYVNMIKPRIVDPLKVVRTVLVDASGVADKNLTTQPYPELMMVEAHNFIKFSSYSTITDEEHHQFLLLVRCKLICGMSRSTSEGRQASR